jgi:5-methylcytosine-specific restriction endonuclease McrA
MNEPVLVLNASYEPLSIISVRRAVVLVLTATAEMLERSEHVVRSPSLIVPAPSVVRLMRYVRARNPRISGVPSRQRVLERDHFTCQYCGQRHSKQSSHLLTLDHVTPRSQGGRATYDNLVACCLSCNQRKADRTPESAGMRLLKKPVSFAVFGHHQIITYHARQRPDWAKYLFV